MKQLDKKVIWLFFFQYCIGYFVLFFSLGIIFIPLFLTVFTGNTVPAESVWFLSMGTFAYVVFLLFTVVISYTFAYLSYHFWKYELGSEALKIEKGIIWKKYISIPYERIQNVDIYRGILARILGLSDIQMQTAGYSGQMISEGRLPGLNLKVAEELRDELIKKVKGKQGI